MKFNLCVIKSVMNKYGIGNTEIHWKSFDTEKDRVQYLEELKEKFDNVFNRAEEINNNINSIYVLAEKEVK